MIIKVLGTGCPKCNSLEKLTRKVIADNNISAEIKKVDDILEIMDYGIMRTPALVVDEKVKLSGRLPSEKELFQLLTSK